MSLSALKEFLSKAEYRPHTARLSSRGEKLFSLLSPEVGEFVRVMIGDPAGGAHIGWNELIPAEPWRSGGGLLDRYESLDGEHRAELLAFCTFYLHEITHHIDFLTTPFGANFHGKACLEYLLLQDFSRKLVVRKPDALSEPLVDIIIESQGQAGDELIPLWHDLRGKLYFFDAVRGAHDKHVAPGWGSRTDPLNLLGQQLTKITVYGFMPSVSIPGDPRAYLRPSTILESRALAHSLRHILFLLGSGALAREEIARYLKSFYSEADVASDYTFLLDLYARLWGGNCFIDVIDKVPAEWLDQVFGVMSGVGWYALQAPPPMDANSQLHSSPVARLIYALRMFEHWVAGDNPCTYDSMVSFLDQIDGDEKARHLWFRPIEQTLAFTLRYLDTVRQKNSRGNQNAAIREHFDYLLGIQSRQINKRLSKGYASHLGLPEHGNPLFGIDDEMDADQLFFEYEPSEEARSWFSFREHLLFKVVPTAERKKAELERRFGLTELVVPCACGTFISLSVPVCLGHVVVNCPTCDRENPVDVADATKIWVPDDE